MVVAPLRAPRTVSPLIKGCRYVALTTGILYGWTRYNSLARAEVGIQERENKIRAQRDARLAREAAEASKVEMAILAKEVGSEI